MSANGKLEAAMQVEGDSEEEEEVEAPKRKETASAQILCKPRSQIVELIAIRCIIILSLF